MMLRFKYFGDVRKRFCQPDEEEPFERKVGKDSNYRKDLRELISEDPGLSLMKLAKILGVSDTIIHRLAEEDLCFKSYVIKVRQMLSEVQNWLSDNMEMFWSKEFWPPNSPDLNPMNFYVWNVIERDQQIETSQRDISPGRYRGSIRQDRQRHVVKNVPALQNEDRNSHRSKKRLYKIILL